MGKCWLKVSNILSIKLQLKVSPFPQLIYSRSEEFKLQPTGGGQKLRTGRLVLPHCKHICLTLCADNSVLNGFGMGDRCSFFHIQLKMLSATGRTILLVRSFCPPPVNLSNCLNHHLALLIPGIHRNVICAGISCGTQWGFVPSDPILIP